MNEKNFGLVSGVISQGRRLDLRVIEAYSGITTPGQTTFKRRTSITDARHTLFAADPTYSVSVCPWRLAPSKLTRPTILMTSSVAASAA